MHNRVVEKSLRIRLLTVFALTLATFGPAHGQDHDWDPTQVQASRADLEALLQRYETNAGAPAYSGALRAQAEREANLIRQRLERGDFQVGDQVALIVEGEEQLTSTFTVQRGPSLVLPVIGSVSLEGVLRSELEPHLRKEVGRYIRDPALQARSSMRIMITGAVGKAGYHVVPANMVVSDILVVAGGPAPTAELTGMRIERGGERIWEGESLQRAIIEGRTLDQLGFRAGDHVVVPEARRGGVWGAVQPLLAVASSLGFLITLLLR